MSKQVNITMSESWLIQLKRLSRTLSVDVDETITYLDLIRDAIKEKYNLVDDVDSEQDKDKV
ncbi:MAG: hypothetical protein AABY32_00585 [Nanoarchaeota archaeon]